MRSDKAALPYQGQPQLQRACELLQSLGLPVFVSVRADQQHEILRSRWPQIIDNLADIGPLAGIAAAQAAYPEAAWLVIACDLPLLTEPSVQYLLQQRDPTRLATAYANPDRQPEPLCTIWEPATAALIHAAIAAGEYSPRRLLQTWNILLINPLDPNALNNVNTPDEYRQANAALNEASLNLQLQYLAIFREQAGKRSETLNTTSTTPALLYAELQQRYGFKLAATQLKVAVNNEFCDWQTPLKSGDAVAFIPPVAGG